MDIVKEIAEDLTATVRIKLTPADYEGKVNEMIKKTQKTANMPGFRKGMVPVGMIRKMYGKAILFDELNKIVSESLEKYITENNIEILGNPLPRPLQELQMDWEKPLDYEFSFDLGLAPQFDLQLPIKQAVQVYEIEVDDKRVNDYVEEIRMRSGTLANTEISDDKSIFYGQFEELDETGQVKEGGIKNASTLFPDKLKDDSIKKQLTGIQQGDQVVMNLQKAYDGNVAEIAKTLQIKQDEASRMSSDFRFTANSISNQVPAEMNQELFNKVYGEGIVNSEAEFREKVRGEIAAMFSNESDRKLQHDLEDVLLEEVKFSLPDNFLKRWMHSINEKPVTEGQLDEEYPRHARGIKWRLIENKIFKENGLNITNDEIMNFAKQLVYDQFARYGSQFTEEETVNQMAERYIKKDENLNYIIESITGRKVFQLLTTMIKKDVKKVTYDEFVKIVTEHRH